MELTKTILSGGMLFAFFFAIAYLIDYFFRRRQRKGKNTTWESVRVGLFAAAIDMLIFLSFYFLFPFDDDQKGLPGWFLIREGLGLWLIYCGWVIGTILVYLSPIFIVRRILSKRRK